MYTLQWMMRPRRLALLLILISFTLSGCKPWEVVGGTVLAGARTPSSEIEQVYYLGVFDPEEQLPPTVYRVRVHGQASILSNVRYGSGWVKSELVDSLGSNIKFNDDNGIEMSGEEISDFTTGRRLMLFGPEGFRKVPKDHRLVIVMGSDPSAFFEAVDGALGDISRMQAEQLQVNLNKELFEAFHRVRAEHERLVSLERDLDRELPEAKEVQQ
ncbi:MAG: hypothetical protein KAS88_00875 [Deltaproteobacteria bacterium]|nr:hypothetical protein [Deltaproteobacteria bacterium]